MFDSNDPFQSGLPPAWLSFAEVDQGILCKHNLIFAGLKKNNIYNIYPDAPCMEYLPTFALKITQM